MQRLSHLLAGIVVPSLIVAACGTAVYPRVGGISDRYPALPPAGPAANPGPDLVEGAGGTAVRQVCRNHGAPSGWVITQYRQGGDECAHGEGDNGFNVAVIEHLRHASGRTLTICADQAVPRGWRRDLRAPPSHECVGARVAHEQPTSVVIRRS
jgi:hypothetical protein